MVTHRVVAVRTDLTGQVEFQTQGDANDAPDAAWVRPEQVRGELWYAVPHLGHVTRWLSTTQRELLVQVAAGLLLLYAAAMFTKGLVTARRRPAADAADSRDLLTQVSA